jgi:hypothetical protein
MKIAKVSTKANVSDSGMDTGMQKKFGSGVFLKNVAERGAQDSTKDGGEYLQDVDLDLSNIFLFAQGRVRFGDGTSGARGENISGEFRTFTTAGANTEVVVPHTVGAIPVGRIVLMQDKAGHLYSSTTAWTATNIYVKCDVATVTFKIFLLK